MSIAPASKAKTDEPDPEIPYEVDPLTPRQLEALTHYIRIQKEGESLSDIQASSLIALRLNIKPASVLNYLHMASQKLTYGRLNIRYAAELALKKGIITCK